MVEEMEEFASDYMKPEDLKRLFGPKIGDVGVPAEAAKWVYETDKTVNNGGKYYGLHSVVGFVMQDQVAALSGPGIRPP